MPKGDKCACTSCFFKLTLDDDRNGFNRCHRCRIQECWVGPQP